MSASITIPVHSVQMAASEERRRATFDSHYAANAGRVYRYCLRLMKDNDDAADAFQECWFAFFRLYVTEEREVENMNAYVFSIARSVCLTRLTRNPSRHEVVDDLQSYAVAEEVTSVTELQELVDKALEVVEPTAREVYILHDLEGFSYEEIEAITGLSRHALRNRVWRVRGHVRQSILPFLEQKR